MKRRKFLIAVCLSIFIFVSGQALAEKDHPLSPYPSLEELYEEVNSFAKNHPELVSLEELGKSVEGRPIYLLRFGFAKSPSKPKALIAGGIHAEEFIGVAVGMETARELIQKSETAPAVKELLTQIEIDLIPVQNPDGYNRVYETNGKGGEKGMRKNANGVDLNRNFPVVPGAKSLHPLAGNRRPRSNYYMGPSELSEPESRAMAELVKSGNYFVVFNLHSVAGKFLYPYTHTKTPAPDQELFIEIGKAFQAGQQSYKYKIQQSYSWYPTLGDPDDYNYLALGIPSFTIEVSTVGSNLADKGFRTFKEFWIANPGEKYDYWIKNDAPGLILAIDKAYQLTGGKPLEKKAKWEKQ